MTYKVQMFSLRVSVTQVDFRRVTKPFLPPLNNKKEKLEKKKENPQEFSLTLLACTNMSGDVRIP